MPLYVGILGLLGLLYFLELFIQVSPNYETFKRIVWGFLLAAIVFAFFVR